MKNTNFRDQCSLRKLENCHCQFYKEDFSQYVYMIYLVVASTTAVCPVSEVRSWFFFSLFLFFLLTSTSPTRPRLFRQIRSWVNLDPDIFWSILPVFATPIQDRQAYLRSSGYQWQDFRSL